MTSPYLIADLKRDEGLRLAAYQDEGGVWTIGYGHTGSEVHGGLTWTEGQAEDALAADVGVATRGVAWHLSWYPELDPIRQDCLVNMAFNLGVGGLMTFGQFLAFMRMGAWQAAAADLARTAWYVQVGARAERIARQIESGEHVAA